MARIRSLKPEHKTHRKVGRLSDRAYRLWIGLITEADDAGRLVEDVGQFRALVFGYQERVRLTHVAEVLEEILGAGLMRRYVAEGVRMIHFPSWHDHQKIDRPKPSSLPEPDDNSTNVLGSLDEDSSNVRRSLVPDLIRSDPIRSDPPPPVLRTGSPPAGAGSPARRRRAAPSRNGQPEDPGAWPSPAALVALYNAEAPDECPSVQTLDATRRRKARAYLAEFPEQAWWSAVFVQIGASRFLRGLKPGPGHEHFVADFDWLLTKGKDGSSNAVKVKDGRYHD